MIFVDTGAWFAMSVETDINHAKTIAWIASNREPLITTDYVINETLTLLRSRRQTVNALIMGRQFFNGSLSAIHYLSQEEIRSTWQTFQNFSDKDWRFTDCSSKVVIEKLGLPHAFAFDQHFQQFGTVNIVP